jgi:hypothetical protein
VNEPAVLASEHLMRLAAEFDEPQTIENGPNGTRRILYMTGGSFAGARLSGIILPAGRIGSRHARMASFSSISV